MKKKKKLVRQQLEVTLRKFRPLLEIPMPPKGWIRAVRDALGMSGRQLADLLKVSRQRASIIEKDELSGSTTIKTMRRVAESLDCVFVYALVPRSSLEECVRKQALLVARRRLSLASNTMRLEDQGLNDTDQKNALDDMANELADTLPSTLWDRS